MGSTLNLFLPFLPLASLLPVLALTILLKNKGHLLTMLLALEAITATMIFPLIYFMATSLTNASVVFLFIVITVCEACLGLAIMVSLSRYPSGVLVSSSFFLH